MTDPITPATIARLEIHTCPTCGHEWRHGQHGGHNCADRLKDQLAAQAAEALRLTAEDLRRLALIDAIIPEPLGGAHRDAGAMLAGVSRQVWDSLEPLLALDGATLRARRREKFLEMGRSGVV